MDRDFPRREITIGELRFSVIDAGDGPAVLLLHGFPDSALLWRNQIPALVAAGYRVIAPDQRGFGNSSRPQSVEDYRGQKLAADLIAILDACGVASAHVVGHDWGASLAWLLATIAPRRVDRLVVLSVGHPAVLFGSAEQYGKSWYMLLYQYPFAEEVMMRDDWRLFREWTAGARDVDHYVADLSRPGALTAGINWYRANAGPEVLFRVGRQFDWTSISAPTLGVWSSGDPYLGEESMIASARYVSGEWRYERIDDSGHWIPLDQPDRLNALLLDFLGTGS
ncbi:MAG: alpha/beta fold hydrolase [Dehalococcoidia bacterium]|nr:alpha/beta fold hydrolase [Dehalococcoidia bacterium]